MSQQNNSEMCVIQLRMKKNRNSSLRKTFSPLKQSKTVDICETRKIYSSHYYLSGRSNYSLANLYNMALRLLRGEKKARKDEPRIGEPKAGGEAALNKPMPVLTLVHCFQRVTDSVAGSGLQ
jgi:hypothetical protein